MNQGNQIVLVTGATSGIGEAIAVHLHQEGMKVYGTGRGEPSTHPSGFSIIKLNVNNTDSVQEAVDYVILQEGRLDVLVNNAGVGLAGPVEETLEEEVVKTFDTNVVGLHRTCTAVLPQMRKQKAGKIINIGSIGGMIGLPFRAYYCASKFATEGFSEALSMEVRQYGIKVVLVQPGDMNTKINDNRIESENDTSSVYHKDYNYVKGIFSNAVAHAPEPIKVAKIVSKVINKRNPALRYKVGGFFENFSHFVKKIVPFRWFETFVTAYYKMR